MEANLQNIDNDLFLLLFYEYGDKNHLFYDDKSSTKKEIKSCLSAFDSDSSFLSSVYQDKFVPKLKDKSHNFTKWLIDHDFLGPPGKCPNAKSNPECDKNMEFILVEGAYDDFVKRCKNCSKMESIRKDSIFSGLKCNLRSVIRILYGWVKGMEIEMMATMLGLPKELIGIIYNRAAKLAVRWMCLCPGIGEFGGQDVVVLVDIYPHLLRNLNALQKPCRPIFCLSEIESIPQKYWLEPIESWDQNNPEDVKNTKEKVINLILSLVKPGSILVLPNKSTLPLFEDIDKLSHKYPIIKTIDDLINISAERGSFSFILDTIWKTPLNTCEQAQYFNPDNVSQFLVRQLWNEQTREDSFIMLMSFIVYETRRKNIHKYVNE